MTTPQLDLELVDADGDRIAFRVNRTDPRDQHPVEVWLGGRSPQPAWMLEAALSVEQARALGAWLAVLDEPIIAREYGPDRLVTLLWGERGPRPVLIAPTVLQALVDQANAHRASHGRPYTDDELARTPSAERDAILTRALDGDAVVTHVEGEPQPTQHRDDVWFEQMADGDYLVWAVTRDVNDPTKYGLLAVGQITAEQHALAQAGR